MSNIDKLKDAINDVNKSSYDLIIKMHKQIQETIDENYKLKIRRQKIEKIRHKISR